MNYWVLNISSRAINFPEFQLVLQPRQKLNLLRHNSKITEEKINWSLNFGTLKKKRQSLIISKSEILPLDSEKLTHVAYPLALPDRSIVQIEKSEHEDLFTNQIWEPEEIDE